MNKVKLKEIAKINDKTFQTNDFDEILFLDTSSVTKGVFDGYIHLSKGDSIPSRAKRAVRKNTIVYSTVRPNLRHFGIFDNPQDNIVVSTGFATIDVNDELADPFFLYYYLTQDRFTDYLHTIATNSVSSYPSINPSDLGNLELEIPRSTKAQAAIARVLSSLDDKIELNNKINRELENLARTIYEYWFVQFDYPDLQGKPYKSSGGKMVHVQRLGREIPAGWEAVPLSDLVEVFNGATPSSINSSYYGGDIVWITPKDLSDQKTKFTDSGERTITQEGFNSCSTKMLPEHSILFSSRAPIGLISIARKNLCTNQGFKNLVPHDKTDTNYLYFYLQRHLKQIETLGAGTTFKELSRESLLTYHILRVKNSVIYNEWIKISKNIFDKQYSLQKESAQLARLRDFLLPLLMNGQVSVTTS